MFLYRAKFRAFAPDLVSQYNYQALVREGGEEKENWTEDYLSILQLNSITNSANNFCYEWKLKNIWQILDASTVSRGKDNTGYNLKLGCWLNSLKIHFTHKKKPTLMCLQYYDTDAVQIPAIFYLVGKQISKCADFKFTTVD